MGMTVEKQQAKQLIQAMCHRQFERFGHTYHEYAEKEEEYQWWVEMEFRLNARHTQRLTRASLTIVA